MIYYKSIHRYANNDAPEEIFLKEFTRDLRLRGYDATFRFFGDYQGYYIDVQNLGKFWLTDIHYRGEQSQQDRNKLYSEAVLIDLQDGTESSANRDNYFTMSPDFRFDDHVLRLVYRDGREEEIEEPRVKDLPRGEQILTTFSYESGSPVTEIYVLTHDSTGYEIEIGKDQTTGKIDTEPFWDYCWRMAHRGR